MKLAVFENEYESVRGAFETCNFLNFNNNIQIDVFTSSQNADMSIIRDYLAIFIDIDLSSKSELDGFGLIQKIQSIDSSLTKKIVILTGNNRIVEAMKERNVYSEHINIIVKPTDYEEITVTIKKIIKSNT